jgi:phosphoglucomutase
MNIPQTILDQVAIWQSPLFDEQTQEAVVELMASNPKELEECFYKNLEFGTGGMRGVMGVGTNRINKYTLGKNTQGLSNYMRKAFTNKELKVVIAYDCRHNSKTLAKVVADVFSANGIKVFLFSDLRPTPELSFALKYLGCQAGIVLTASHNPPEYNGYKVYWEDGGQLVPPQDTEIVEVIESLNYNEIKFDANENLIEYIDNEVDAAFIKSSVANASFNTLQKAKDNLTIVFTPLHGTSVTVTPQTLAAAGYKNVHLVKEQETPNGDFPTVQSPNPEEPEALRMALELAEKTNADIVIGTDPDCDRLGIAVRNSSGKMTLLNGNQAMVLMTHFLLEQWKKAGKINGKQFVGSTIVSTPMIGVLAADYGVDFKVGLTGFKWIAKMIKDFPELEFIGGGEESFGYMVGDAVRDKDAVASTLLICEVAAQAKEKGLLVLDELQKLYVKYGFFKEHLVSLTKKGRDGLAEINEMMVNLRENPIKVIDGEEVVIVEDYKTGKVKNLKTGKETVLELPKSDVLIYTTQNNTRIAARPSGTEPKIKFYMSVNAPVNGIENIDAVEKNIDNKIQNIITAMQLR